VPKIISEHCELVKLCDISCSGLVFLRHTETHIFRHTSGVQRTDKWSDGQIDILAQRTPRYVPVYASRGKNCTAYLKLAYIQYVCQCSKTEKFNIHYISRSVCASTFKSINGQL